MFRKQRTVEQACKLFAPIMNCWKRSKRVKHQMQQRIANKTSPPSDALNYFFNTTSVAGLPKTGDGMALLFASGYHISAGTHLEEFALMGEEVKSAAIQFPAVDSTTSGKQSCLLHWGPVLPYDPDNTDKTSLYLTKPRMSITEYSRRFTMHLEWQESQIFGGTYVTYISNVKDYLRARKACKVEFWEVVVTYDSASYLNDKLNKASGTQAQYEAVLGDVKPWILSQCNNPANSSPAELALPTSTSGINTTFDQSPIFSKVNWHGPKPMAIDRTTGVNEVINDHEYKAICCRKHDMSPGPVPLNRSNMDTESSGANYETQFPSVTRSYTIGYHSKLWNKTKAERDVRRYVIGQNNLSEYSVNATHFLCRKGFVYLTFWRVEDPYNFLTSFASGSSQPKFYPVKALHNVEYNELE